MSHQFEISLITPVVTYPPELQACNCINPITGQRICLRHDKSEIRISNIETNQNSKYKILFDEIRSIIQALNDIAYNPIPSYWFPKYRDLYCALIDDATGSTIIEVMGSVPLQGYSGISTGGSGLGISVDETKKLLYEIGADIIAQEIDEDGVENDILTVSMAGGQNLGRIKWGANAISGMFQPEICAHNPDLVDFSRDLSVLQSFYDGEWHQPAVCKRLYSVLSGWSGKGLFKDKVSESYYWLNQGMYDQESEPCSNRNCPGYEPLSTDPESGSISRSIDFWGRLGPGDIVIFISGKMGGTGIPGLKIAASGSGLGAGTVAYEYDGEPTGRQYLIDEILDENRLRLRGFKNNQLLEPYDHIHLYRKKGLPVWDWISEPEFRTAQGMLTADVGLEDTRWNIQEGHTLRVGDIGRCGQEYVQVIDTGTDWIEVAREYRDPIDMRTGRQCYSVYRRINEDRSIYPDYQSIKSVHHAGSSVVVEWLRKCRYDYKHPMFRNFGVRNANFGMPGEEEYEQYTSDGSYGYICLKNRLSVEGYYQCDSRNAGYDSSQRICTNTCCPWYFAEPERIYSDLFHQFNNRIHTRQIKWYAGKYNCGSGDIAAYYYITEIEGPSLMSLVGKWGLFDSAIARFRFSWGVDELAMSQVSNSFPYNGSFGKIYPDAYVLINGIYTRRGEVYSDIDTRGEFVVGGDMVEYLKSTGQIKFNNGLILAALGNQDWRLWMNDDNDPRPSLNLSVWDEDVSELLGIRRNSIPCWGVKPISSWEGKI